MIGGFSILTISASCFFRRLLLYRSHVAGCLARGHPASGMSIPVDVVRVES